VEIILFTLGLFVFGLSINKFTTDRYLRFIVWSFCGGMMVWMSLYLLTRKVLISFGMGV